MTLRLRIGAAAVALALFALAVPVAGQPSSVNDTFDPIIPRLANRPATLIETDSYVYGPGTGKASPELSITIADNDWDAPATIYAYWQNRNSGADSRRPASASDQSERSETHSIAQTSPIGGATS